MITSTLQVERAQQGKPHSVDQFQVDGFLGFASESVQQKFQLAIGVQECRVEESVFDKN